MRRLHFALHAMQRYVERHAPGLSLAEATRRLQDAVPSARRLRSNTPRGEEQWLAESIGVVFVIKRDGPGGERASCVTILPVGAEQEYVHEQRVSLPTVADPSTTALRLAMKFVVERAGVDDDARRTRDQIAEIAPWAVRPSFVDASNDSARTDDDLEHAPPRDVHSDARIARASRSSSAISSRRR